MRLMLIATIAVASVLAGGATIAQTPTITAFLPAQIPPITGPGPVAITAIGSGYIPGVSQMYANGLPMLTTVTSSTALTFQLTNGVLQAALPGAVTVTIVNPPNLASNSGPLMIEWGTAGGVGANRGVIGFHPLGYAPGQSIQLSLESFWPNQPFALMADTGTPLPIAPFPPPIPGQPGGFFVLGVTPFGPGFSIVMDGIGLIGPPNPLFVTQYTPPPGSPPYGTFLLPPFQTPSPPSGLFVSLQAVYLDISSPDGWTLSWTKYPFTL